VLQTSLATGGIFLAVAAIASISQGTRVLLVVGAAVTVGPTLLSLVSLATHPFADPDAGVWLERRFRSKKPPRSQLNHKSKLVWISMFLLIVAIEMVGGAAFAYQLHAGHGHHPSQNSAEPGSTPGAQEKQPTSTATEPSK